MVIGLSKYPAPSPRRKLFEFLPFLLGCLPFAVLPRTPVVCRRERRFDPCTPSRMKNSGRNRRSRFFRESNPKPLRLSTRSTRELHHPGTVIPRRMSLDRNELGDEFTVARTSRPRDPIALVSIRLGFYFRVSSLLSRSVRIPGKPGNTTEVSRK